MQKIGNSKNAQTFRWLASQIKVGEIQHSTNRADNHDGITPAFLRKLEAKGLIQILPNTVRTPKGIKTVRGESRWKLLAEVPAA